MDRSQYRNKFGYKLGICLYTVTGILLLSLAGSTKSKAQQAPSNTNIAGPSASATGNVTNQAVQVLQGPYAMNTYGGGVSCQGPTMSVAPFALGNFNGSQDPESYQSYNGNFVVSLGFNFPLDGSLQELCKERARTEIKRQNAEADKARLDFELVRLLKCGEAKKSGIDFHPNSPYASVCADVIIQPPKIVTIDPVGSLNIKTPPKQVNGQTQK
jgi:hypothetical protein